MATSLEIILLVFFVFALIKLAVIVVDRKRWLPVVEAVYGHQVIAGTLALLIAAWMFYMLIQQLSIVQIASVMIFTMLLVMIAFLGYGNEMRSMSRKLVSLPLRGFVVIYAIIWVALLACAVWQILT